MILLAVVAGLYIYNKSCEMEALRTQVETLRTQNQELNEIKGRYEAQKMFMDEKVSSSNQVSNMDRVLTMLEKYQNEMGDKFKNVEEKEKKCSEHLDSLHHDLTTIQSNITELVRQRERAVMQANLYSDKLQACKNSLAAKCERG